MVPQPDIGATHRAGCLCKAKNSDSLSYFSPVTPAPPTLALEHCCPSRAAEGTHSHHVGERLQSCVVCEGLFLLKACSQSHVTHLGTEKSIKHHAGLPCRRTLSMVHVHHISLSRTCARPPLLLAGPLRILQPPVYLGCQYGLKCQQQGRCAHMLQ